MARKPKHIVKIAPNAESLEDVLNSFPDDYTAPTVFQEGTQYVAFARRRSPWSPYTALEKRQNASD